MYCYVSLIFILNCVILILPHFCKIFAFLIFQHVDLLYEKEEIEYCLSFCSEMCTGTDFLVSALDVLQYVTLHQLKTSFSD